MIEEKDFTHSLGPPSSDGRVVPAGVPAAPAVSLSRLHSLEQIRARNSWAMQLTREQMADAAALLELQRELDLELQREIADLRARL